LTHKVRCVQKIIAAHTAYLAGAREANWMRRRAFLCVLADNGLRPLNARRLLLERDALGPLAKLPPVPVGTPEAGEGAAGEGASSHALMHTLSHSSLVTVQGSVPSSSTTFAGGDDPLRRSARTFSRRCCARRGSSSALPLSCEEGAC
jgi:hypothetical protein